MDHSPKKGLLRPKPIDSMIFILTIYNISEYSVNWPTLIMCNLAFIRLNFVFNSPIDLQCNSCGRCRAR
jgi:hypothetical protein